MIFGLYLGILYIRIMVQLNCENPSCRKKLTRKPSAVSPHNYCSCSCSVKISNAKRLRIKKPKIIKPPRFRHTKETIVMRIRDFVTKNKRIPVKREMNGIYQVTRKFYGTWNEAIKSAGFEPNPVMFANRQVAKDGHECDSLAEKMIDDYLFDLGIEHERNCPYPEGDYTADFKIKEKYIEYFGLSGHEPYDEIMETKKDIAMRHKINLLEIYPKNIYRKNGLEETFKEVVTIFPKLVD